MKYFVVLLLACALSASGAEILLGQTAPLTGPSSALGLGVQAGLEASFAEINAHGGINGSRVRLITLDDGYEPARAEANARTLIEVDHVFALIGSVGTPTAARIVPVCNASHVPFIAPFSGAAGLRTPYNPLIIHLRASYGQEIERLTALMVDGRELHKIACFYQDDLFGLAGLKALQASLRKRALAPVALGNYVRNSSDVASAVGRISGSKPDAVLMVGTYAACAEFVRQMRAQGHNDTLYCSISFVGTRALSQALGSAADGLVVSQVVPNPTSSLLPITADYAAALKTNAPDAQPDWISFEGYLDGRLFVQLAIEAGVNPTRESFGAAAQSTVPRNLDGFALQFSPSNNQGSNCVFLVQIKGGHFVSME